MSKPLRALAAFPFAMLLVSLLVGLTTWAAAGDATKPAPQAGTVFGLVTDKQAASITIQVDGEDEPTKYVIGQGTDKRSVDVLKTIFTVDRVKIRYKVDGDASRVIDIQKVVGQPAGIAIGEVLKVYNNFWVAVKPKGGVPDGYALNWPPEKYKASAEILKTLKPGDLVAIKYTTDGERHRIQQIEVKPGAAK